MAVYLELSEHERFVLRTAYAHKNASYAYKLRMWGRDSYDIASETYHSFVGPFRPEKPFLSRAEWNAAKQKLITCGLLNKAGAITVAGENAVRS